MRKTGTHDVMMSAVSAAVDGLTVFGSFILAAWIRFDSGWLPPSTRGGPSALYTRTTPAWRQWPSFCTSKNCRDAKPQGRP